MDVGCRVRLGRVKCGMLVWSIWTSRNDIIFAGGSSTIDNLVDRVKLSSWKWFLGKNSDIALALSTIGRCNLSCVGPT
ncbi:hypothetical protein L195_g059164, partial [Trifolium pratense]